MIVPGIEERVRPRVPDQFELVRDPLARPLLAVVAGRFERVTLDDTTRPVRFALFLAVIESPDGSGCSSGWPLIGAVKPDLVPLCNFYAFFAAGYDPAVVRWVRGLVPEAPMSHVPGHVFSEQGFDPTRLGAPFHFRAGPRTPSRFEIDAVVRQGQMRGPFRVSLWFIRSSRLERVTFETDEWEGGLMDATLRVTPGSEMASLLGTATPRPLAGIANRYGRAGFNFPPLRGSDGEKASRPGLSLTGLRLWRKRFRAARRGRAVAPRGRRPGRRVGTRIRYRLNRDAMVTFRVQRAGTRKGRVVGRRCVRGTERNARRRRCTRYRTLPGKFTHRGRAGVNRLRWTGRLRGRSLRRGRYRLIARARVGLGVRSRQARAPFEIVGR